MAEILGRLLNFDELSHEDKLIVDMAIDAQSRAYAPYSRFKVGAALYAVDMNFYQGCNVENASYPNGCCAEKSSIVQMVTAGVRQWDTLALIGAGTERIVPCGSCLQVLNEFVGNGRVLLVDTACDTVLEVEFRSLLPYSF